MARLGCPRGHTILLKENPTPGERYYFTEDQIDVIAARVAERYAAATKDGPLSMDIFDDGLMAQFSKFYFCPTCGALVMPDESPPKWFLNV